MKNAMVDTGFVESEAMLDGDDLIDLGRMSQETRGAGFNGFEGLDCMPRENHLCPR